MTHDSESAQLFLKLVPSLPVLLGRDTAGAHSRGGDQGEGSGTQPSLVLATESLGIKRRGVELDVSSEQNIGTARGLTAQRVSTEDECRSERY